MTIYPLMIGGANHMLSNEHSSTVCNEFLVGVMGKPVNDSNIGYNREIMRSLSSVCQWCLTNKAVPFILSY